MIDSRTFALRVRKDIVLDIMDDTTKYKDNSKANDTVIFEKTRTTTIIACPNCNHMFESRNSPLEKNRKKKSSNINDASANA